MKNKKNTHGANICLSKLGKFMAQKSMLLGRLSKIRAKGYHFHRKLDKIRAQAPLIFFADICKQIYPVACDF